LPAEATHSGEARMQYLPIATVKAEYVTHPLPLACHRKKKQNNAHKTQHRKSELPGPKNDKREEKKREVRAGGGQRPKRGNTGDNQGKHKEEWVQGVPI